MDPLYDEILDEVESLGGMPHAERAELFTDRAHAMEPGTPGRAAWLSHAAEAWELAREPARAKGCYEEAVADGGDAYIDPRAELVGVLLDLGESGRADELLTELRRDLREGRTVNHVHDMVGEALEMHGRLEDALGWFDAGLSLAEREDAGSADIVCLNGHYRVRRALGLPRDRYDEQCEEHRREYAHEMADDEGLLVDVPGEPGGASPTMTVLYWPPDEFERAVERFPVFVERYGTAHDGHRVTVERHLRALAQSRSGLAVSVGDLDDYMAFAEGRGIHTPDASTRATYAAHVARLGRTVPWPPRRNDRCWCGSGVKYKKCCGAVRDEPVSGD